MNRKTLASLAAIVVLSGLVLSLLSFDFQADTPKSTKKYLSPSLVETKNVGQLPNPHKQTDITAQAEKKSTSLLVVPGRVVDNVTNQPVVNATVKLESVTLEQPVDKSGRFAIPCKVAKPYMLVVEAPGYLRTAQKVVPVIGYSNLMTVKLQSTATGTIQGSVEFEGQIPESYTVAFGRKRFTYDGNTLTFTIEDVPVGPVRIGVCGQGYNENFPVVQTPILVRADRVTKVHLFVPVFGAVEGVVKDERGRIVPNADVYLGPGVIRAGADGKFKAVDLHARKYRPYVHHPKYGNQWVEPIQVEKGQIHSVEYRLKIQGDLELTGTVKGHHAGELLTVKVLSAATREQFQNPPPELKNRGLSYSERSRVDHFKIPQFRFYNLAPGKYLVQVFSRSGSGFGTVTISDNRPNHVEVTLQKPSTGTLPVPPREK